MALNKDFQTKFGVTATYHKLLKVEVDAGREFVELIVGMYASEEAKNSGANSLWTEYVRVPFDRLNFDPRDIFYPLLKHYDQSYLVGATDNILADGIIHPPVFEIVESPPPTPIITPSM